MAVKLRLMRMGKKKQPTYRIVAADARSPRDGRFIEIVGTYDPRAEPSVVNVDNERAVHWLRHGAQPTERVQKLLAISGAWEEFGGAPLAVPATPKKQEPAAEEPAAEEPAAEEPAAEEPAAEEAPAAEAAAAEEPAATEAPTDEAPAEEPAAEDDETAEATS